MDRSFRARLATHLRRLRGEETLARYARRIGISESTLHRIENRQQNVAIDTLQTIADRLRCDIGELFPPLEE